MKSIGTLSDIAGSRIEPEGQQTEIERIIALERRVSTLELLLNDVMHQLDTQAPQQPSPNPSASTPKKKKPPPKSKHKQPHQKQKKQKLLQPWENPDRLAEISKLADRILASEICEITKAETISQFDVDTKLAGQTLAWMVKTGKMSIESPEPTEDDPDPKKVFRVK